MINVNKRKVKKIQEKNKRERKKEYTNKRLNIDKKIRREKNGCHFKIGLIKKLN